MKIYIQVEFENGKIHTLEVQQSEVKDAVKGMWKLKEYGVVNVTVIRKGLQ